MIYSTLTLPNGLRLIHRQSASPVAYCGFAVDAGTRDEGEQESGMAHFVEHLLFKGTRKRKAWHILNRMENVGADLNAYTNKEETVVYAAFLSRDLERAVELLADIVFHAVFPAREITKEVEVIIDEIQSYRDSPAELIFDDFEEMIFRNHPLGRNILGTPESLRQFDTAAGLAFTARHYRPDNMVFFVWGDMDFKRVVRLVEKYTADVPALPTTDPPTASLRIPPPPYRPEQLIVHHDTHQAHVIIGGRSYATGDEQRTALYLLSNLLGGPGMNSRLNVALRERRGLVYNVESSLTSYTDTGMFCVYFGADIDDVDTCLRLIRKEFRLLCDTKLSAWQLAAAKKQLIGQIGVASDNNENNALGMGKVFLHDNQYDLPEEIYRRIDRLTPEALWDVANEMLTDSYLSTLIYR
ncbi:MAG: insulinase family protein [Prevotellaceae bacterium]|nr:insulinase family protein [Prevotellaceae bacterium]